MDDEIRVFNKFLIPLIGDKIVEDVNTDDIDAMQKQIIQNSASRKNSSTCDKVPVKNYLAFTRQVFNLAQKKKLIQSNPVTEIESLGASGSRDRVLSFREIWLFWHKIELCGVPVVTAKALKFMFATMQRGV